MTDCNPKEKGTANFTSLSAKSYSREREKLQSNYSASLIHAATPAFFGQHWPEIDFLNILWLHNNIAKSCQATFLKETLSIDIIVLPSANSIGEIGSRYPTNVSDSNRLSLPILRQKMMQSCGMMFIDLPDGCWYGDRNI